ncbi:MAG TPA: succinate dehydrogenase [Candidatus Thermoplasmatota archaeon]|nr:succinate dehydrogenase [Candidatus Thermoplasmatota archaeon]
MSTSTPGSPSYGYGSRARPSGGYELGWWIFMRVSGVLLLFLALGHLYLMHVAVDIEQVTAEFALARMFNPFWRIYDLSMLFLALIHGVNGVRVILEDYVQHKGWLVTLKYTTYTVAAFFLLLGTYVLLTLPTVPGAR